ncbi:hypothetical protein IF2G_10359 [Cordyceps javanica]|nr:hypothetical protein IF2G_10359 [Cordyceps javanica]
MATFSNGNRLGGGHPSYPQGSCTSCPFFFVFAALVRVREWELVCVVLVVW